MRTVMMLLAVLMVSGCWEEQTTAQVKREICSELDRQKDEALAARDRANAGLTGGARTPRVPTCTE